jgi:hypothetical protein
MTTLIDVLDTFVKIGLGAAISGVTTYAITSAKSKSDLDFSYRQRKRELLETVAEGVEHFTSSILRYWSLKIASMNIQMRYVQAKNKSVESSNDSSGKDFIRRKDDLMEKLEITREEVMTSARELSNAESKLMLLGYVESQKLLRGYGEFFNENIFMVEWLPSQGEIDKLKSKKEDILERRKKFFDALKNDYDNLYSLK